MSKYKTPTKSGFYWAKWRICADGTADEEMFQPEDRWCPVEVYVNTSDPTDDDFFRVFVLGVEKSQPIDGFVWGPRVEGCPSAEKAA